MPVDIPMLSNLPLELLTRIATLLNIPDRQDLLALCLTSKALQAAAEPILFEQVNAPTPAACLSVCRILAENAHLALHVRRFTFAPDARHAPRNPSPPGQTLWSTLQRALEEMTQLSYLLLSDTSFNHSWIFSSPALPTHLRELRMRVSWDPHTVSFVSRQRDLRLLQVYDSIDDTWSLQNCSVNIHLPVLETFDGMLSIGVHFVKCGLVRMQLTVDCENESTLACIARFGPLRSTLRALNFLDAGDEMTLPILELLGRLLPDLRHVGILSYTVNGRHQVHRCLMYMHYLHSIELDMSRWPGGPQVSSPAVQRMLADELRVYCPTLRVIVFWLSFSTRVRWSVNSEGTVHTHHFGGAHDLWQSRGEQGVFQQMGDTWRTA